MNKNIPPTTVFLSNKGALSKSSEKVYNSLLELQRNLGCTFNKLECNSRQFDNYVGRSYLKAMTEKGSGRTRLLIGKDQHGVAGQNDFNIDPDPYTNKTGKGFGNLIRWAYLGNTLERGIILVDYDLNGKQKLGNATILSEVKEVANRLVQQGFPSQKEVYLTDCVRIYEPPLGKVLRENRRIITLEDWCRDSFEDIELILKSQKPKKVKRDKNTENKVKIELLPYASSALTASWG